MQDYKTGVSSTIKELDDGQCEDVQSAVVVARERGTHRNRSAAFNNWKNNSPGAKIINLVDELDGELLILGSWFWKASN